MGRKRPWARQYVYLCIACLTSFFLFNCATLQDFKKREEIRESILRGQKLLIERDYEGAINEYQKALFLSNHKPPEDEALFDLGLIYAHFGYPKRDYEKSLKFFLTILNDYPNSPRAEHAKIWVGVLHENEKTNQMIENLKQIFKEQEKAKQTIIVVKEPEKPEKPKQPEPKTEEHGEAREYLLRSQKLLAQGDYDGSILENQKVLSLPNPRSPKDEALFNLGLIYAHLGNPKRDSDKSIDFFKRVIKEYPKSPLVEQAKIWESVLREREELNQVIEKLKQVDIEVEEMKKKKPK